eukprot:jgi/Phyca11/12320/fgenesh1_pm.PHYCAscaffold_105_\
MCEHCVQQYTSRRHLSSRRRYCADNPNKVKSKKARLEADAQLAYVYHDDGVGDEVEHGDNTEEESDDDFYIDNDDAVDAESDDESEDGSEEEGEEEEGGEVGEAERAEESEWECEAESAQDSK